MVKPPVLFDPRTYMNAAHAPNTTTTVSTAKTGPTNGFPPVLFMILCPSVPVRLLQGTESRLLGRSTARPRHPHEIGGPEFNVEEGCFAGTKAWVSCPGRPSRLNSGLQD